MTNEYEQKKLDTLPKQACTSFPFLWVRSNFLFQMKERGWLAICGFSRRVAKVAASSDMLTPPVVTSFYVERRNDQPECEERYRCIDVDCPLNRTTKQSLLAAEPYLKKAVKGQKTLKTWSVNQRPDGTLHDHADLLTAHPRGGILIDEEDGA